MKMICKHGHSLADAYVRPNGKRYCAECARIANREYKRRHRRPAVRLVVVGSPLERLLAHVAITPGPLATDCWVSTYADAGRGYAAINVGGRNRYCHRVAYELLVGPIPDGLQLDHLCRMTKCVNPEHLEPVTCKVNVQRGMSPNMIAARANRCRHGHSLDDAYVRPGGRRQCRSCQQIRNGRRSQLVFSTHHQ